MTAMRGGPGRRWTGLRGAGRVATGRRGPCRRWTGRVATGLLAAGLLVPATAALVPAARAWASAAGPGTAIGPGAAVTFVVAAPAVPDPMQSPEGPGVVAPVPGDGVASGEGELWLTMDAPGTSWASPTDTSVVVDVSVDGGLPQQIVLFDGARPFTYTGFSGPLGTGDHRVTVHVDTSLSHTAVAPRVVVLAVHLGVVPVGSPAYDTAAYAPIVYGRRSAASRYTQLLVDASDVTNAAGEQVLSYTYVISAHDQGDSIVPAYQWALWGRMTDIVSMVEETVAPDGTIVSASYASCGCEGIPLFPDWVMAPQETTAAIPASAYDGHHPVLRDASATNYLSDRGTSPFRFQQAPMAAPPPGQLRSAVMDAHPWTYQVSNQELPREHLISTSPDNILVGDYRQYAVIDADVSQHGAQDVQFEIRLAGDPTWYSTDYRQMTAGVPSTFPFNDGGHHRTVVKLPLDWGSRAIVGLRVRLDAPVGTTASGTVPFLRVLEVTRHWRVVTRAYPRPVPVYSAPSLVPVDIPG